MNAADISIVIPVYNRGDLIRYTMESVQRASQGIDVETIVVDDGSDVPVADDLVRLGYAGDSVRVIRKPNQGLLFARLSGFAAATGRCTLFLDSDDLVAPEKLRRQVAAMEASGSDVSYTDIARCRLSGDYDSLVIAPVEPARVTNDAADFFINIQPAPHSPVFRTAYLRDIVHHAHFPPSPLYNCVAEIWFYHNAAPRPGRIEYVPGALTIAGVHPAARLTNHWERLAVASLGVMEAFARSVPATPENARVRRLVGEKAFTSWRRLPRDFSPEFDQRLLALWSRLTTGTASCPALGGRKFTFAAALLGPVRAGRFFRRLQNGPYEPIRTMPSEAFAELLAALPPPGD